VQISTVNRCLIQEVFRKQQCDSFVFLRTLNEVFKCRDSTVNIFPPQSLFHDLIYPKSSSGAIHRVLHSPSASRISINLKHNMSRKRNRSHPPCCRRIISQTISQLNDRVPVLASEEKTSIVFLRKPGKCLRALTECTYRAYRMRLCRCI
jgi:hypothetical protein